MPFDIPFIRPRFPASDLIGADFDAIVESNWYTNFGPREREFSTAIAAYIGEGYHAVTFANATIALMALIPAAFGRGDGTRFVIVPSFTFAAGPEAIEWAGYKPLFIDIDPVSLQPDLADAQAAIEANDVAGILLCNTFGIGNPAVHEWEQLAASTGIPMVADSAAGFGSAYPDGRRVGSATTAEVFSFHATKPFAIGEGGAILTRDSELAASLTSFQNFGFREGRGAFSLGLNGKLQEINAAIGLRQLVGFDETIRGRQRVLAAYRSGFAALPVRFPTAIEQSSVCFASVLFDDKQQRDAALERLRNAGVEARTYYAPAVHTHPYFASARRSGPLRVTDEVIDTVLSLPVYDMSEAEVVTVVGAVTAGSA